MLTLFLTGTEVLLLTETVGRSLLSTQIPYSYGKML